ncbi:CAP domain-containing protein [Infundibulicybe gibba]|nr:CAP domain-containing protein [Infundibulicybe gibba]
MQLQYSLATAITFALFAFATPIYDDTRSEIYSDTTRDMISLPESGQIVFGALQQWDTDTVAFDVGDGADVATLDDWKNESPLWAAPLTWSDALYPGTQQWAQQCKFQHSDGKGAYGENLAAGTGTTYGFSNGLKDWMDEASKYDYNRPGFSSGTGHFTQVVWKSSKQVACAVANCRAGTIFQQASRISCADIAPPEILQADTPKMLEGLRSSRKAIYGKLM